MNSSYQRTPDSTQIEWVCPICIKVIERRADGFLVIPKHHVESPPLRGAEWEAVHASCADGCGWGPLEAIPLNTLTDIEDALEWTATLMRRQPWIVRTNWPEIIAEIHRQHTEDGAVRIVTAYI